MASSYLDRIVDRYVDELDEREAKRAWFDNPTLWAKERLGIDLWYRQSEVADSLVHNRNVAVKAGHGVGKSFLSAVLACWWIDTRPISRAFVATTAPTNDQITGIIWREIRKMYQLSQKLASEDKTGKTKPLPGYITMDNKWRDNLGNLVGQGRKPPDQKAGDAFQGIHDGYVLAMGDEACGLSEEMIDGLANITSNANSRRFLIANPTNPASYFAKLFKDDTGAWRLLTISVLDSPNFHGGGECKCHPNLPLGMGMPDDALSQLSGPEYVEEKKKEFGEDSPRFKARVLGEFAYDAGNVLFNDWTLNQGQNTVVVPSIEQPYRVLGVDVARRDADSTFVYMVEHGVVYKTKDEPDKNGKVVLAGPKKEGGEEIGGLKLRHVDHWRDVPFVDKTDYNTGTVIQHGQARRVHDIAMQYAVKEVRVDASGLGVGLLDPLYELCRGQYAIIEVAGNDPSPDRRSWRNVRAYQLDNMRKLMFDGRIDIDPQDDTLIEQLGGIQTLFAKASDALQIEGKGDMHKRGVKSPDAADSAWYACADFSFLVNGPYAGLNPGDVLVNDLEEYQPSSFHSYSW